MYCKRGRKLQPKEILVAFFAAAFLGAVFISGCAQKEDVEMNTAKEKLTMDEDFNENDIKEFYYTYSSTTNPPEFQRYRFYTEGGKHMYYHEKREGEDTFLSEEDITVSGTMELTQEQWMTFLSFLSVGTVEKRSDIVEDGGSGPWLYLYLKGENEDYQEFHFKDSAKLLSFEEFCKELKAVQTAGNNMANEETLKPARYFFDIVQNDEKASKKAILTAFDEKGDELWNYETEDCYISELEVIQDIGEMFDGYCFIAGGEIYNIATSGDNAGEVAWVNEDFKGASASFLLDERIEDAPKLYLCGYYGPDLMVIDKDGNTIARYENLDFSIWSTYDVADFYWPYGLEFTDDGLVSLTYESNDIQVMFNPENGQVLNLKEDNLGAEE